eukprot:gb/GECH01002491.1/.p1 GENE.gb/GECH01002491.1/~~gb/GECH01002491.1/.p1  ORF type:complete len:262 (+),score=61.72 gb/GECH01002491.1/:1-786(+)
MTTRSSNSPLYLNLRNWLRKPENQDQDHKKKQRFISATSKCTPASRCSALGVSNKIIGAKAKTVFQEHRIQSKRDEIYQQIFTACDELWRYGDAVEDFILAVKIISKYHRFFTQDQELWSHIDEYWIDRVDQWMLNDHLCMEVLGYYPVHEEPYITDVKSWVQSEDHWRRRVGITSMIKNVRQNQDAVKQLFDLLVDFDLLDDRNYYVRKSIVWMLKEGCKSSRNDIAKFVMKHVTQFKKGELTDICHKLPHDSKQKILKR